MRLLDARALVYEGISQLVDDDEVGWPNYAILSHTWGREEVLFEDIALGPNHEIDSLDKEQQITQGYRSDSRPHGGIGFGKFRLRLLKLFQEERNLPGVCKSCQPRNQSLLSQRRSHIKAGWKKIWSACLQACRDGYDYIWIDTCCINKSSSTELAEALNSMFEWYEMSATCYVILEDCKLCPHRLKWQSLHRLKLQSTWPSLAEAYMSYLSYFNPVDGCTEAQIGHCRWVSRGWTLQELIAPSEIKFFDQDWTFIGTRHQMASKLSDVTGVASSLLSDGGLLFISVDDKATIKRQKLHQFPVAVRMSWAAKRQTTRIEDQAYSLLGLFGVSMPLLYGEGNKAFLRLQEEIIKLSNDDSILAWEFVDDIEHEIFENQLLAPSPENFCWWSPRRSSELTLCCPTTDKEKPSFDDRFEITQKSLQITVPLVHRWDLDRGDTETTYHNYQQSTDEIPSERELLGSKPGQCSEEGADLFKTIDSVDFASTNRSETGVTFKKSQALLKCYLGIEDYLSIRIALRLSHTYLDGRHIVSEVVSERPHNDELDRDLRHRVGSRLGERHRLALYLGSPFLATVTDGVSITIRRDGDTGI
jgi:Heterokaryon incompatibility protein (HET)